MLTRVEDRISIVFSDGVFGNLSKEHLGLTTEAVKSMRMVITPDEMKGISIKVLYVSGIW